MTTAEKEITVAAAHGNDTSIVKRLLNSMWGFWLFLLAISFGVAAAIYLIWLKGSV